MARNLARYQREHGRGLPTLRGQLVREAKEDSIRRVRVLYRGPVRRAGAALGGGLSDQPGRVSILQGTITTRPKAFRPSR